MTWLLAEGEERNLQFFRTVAPLLPIAPAMATGVITKKLHILGDDDVQRKLLSAFSVESIQLPEDMPPPPPLLQQQQQRLPTLPSAFLHDISFRNYLSNAKENVRVEVDASGAVKESAAMQKAGRRKRARVAAAAEDEDDDDNGDDSSRPTATAASSGAGHGGSAA